MLKNYLLITFRYLWKNKLFTLINIVGLGIALAVSIVAFFNHMFNYEFDRTHVNFDRIYRVTSFRDMQGREQEYGIVPATLGLRIKQDIPGIEKAARLNYTRSPVKIGDNLFQSEISFVDPDFLDVFTFPIILGDKKSIENRGNVLISRKMAHTLFGDEYPVGKSLSIINDNNKEFTYTVGAVFEDLPQNSSFSIDILSHYDNYLQMWKTKDTDWKTWTTALFVMVPNKSVLSSILSSLKQYLPVQNLAREDFRINRFSLVPLKDVGANTRDIWSGGLYPSLHPAAVIAPPVMALLILLLACFNFANTSIATFSKRMKEIGLRKTFGGQRRQLVMQFLLETMIICFLAMLTGIAIAGYLVPAYSSLWAYMTIRLTFAHYMVFWLFLFLLLLLTGFLSGVYPALYVSSFSPAGVFKGDSPFRGSGRLSSVLLTLQFTISIMALVMGLVFSKNARYQNTLDLGYDKDNIIVMHLSTEFYTSFRNEILSDPKIISVAGTEEHIGYGAYSRPVKDEDKQLEVNVMDIGPEYAKTIGLHLLKGRLFDMTRAVADRSDNSIVINQKMADDFGWTDPLGKVITLYDTTKLTVVGVVRDFYTYGVWDKIEPTMLRLAKSDSYSFMVVRTGKKDLPAVLDHIGKVWKTQLPNYLFTGRAQEDLMQEEKDINGSIMKVNIFLAVVATMLSLIGIYNMVSLDIIRRKREVGIRKVQGAPVPVIMFLISKRYLVVLLIASLMGCAGGYYLSNMLLDSIWDYFVQVGYGILLSAAFIMVSATTLTLIFKIGKAAMKNPADTLRHE
jgi:putative ABC transport system permease protein